MKSILLGLDIGTTKLCAVAVESETGRLVAVESAPNDAHIPTEAGGAEQDPAVVMMRIQEVARRLSTRPELDGYSIDGLGVTGQMHGVLLIDADGSPVSPLVSWQDQRGHRKSTRCGRTYVEELRERIQTEDTGCEPSTGYGAVTLLRLKDEDLIPANSRALTIHDFVVMQLCDVAATDPTDAASWGIFDVRDGQRWLPSALVSFPFMRDLLPSVLGTGTVAGRISSSAARVTGFPHGLPVAVALGDNQASFLGSVPSAHESLLLNLGTGGQISVPIDRFASLPLLETRPLLPGLWLLVGASLCGGRAYQILADFFADVGRELFGCDVGDALYERMNVLADEATEDCDHLCAHTLFEGTRKDPTIRGDFIGISSQNFTPANLTRACIAGMVDELVSMYAQAEDAGANIGTVVGAGNAIRRNPIVRYEIERRLSMPLYLSSRTEEAAVGAALVGGVAAGVYSDWRMAVSHSAAKE